MKGNGNALLSKSEILKELELSRKGILVMLEANKEQHGHPAIVH